MAWATKPISISCEQEIQKQSNEKLYTDFKLNYGNLTVILMLQWQKNSSKLMSFSFFIISSDFHSSVYKINDANSQSATKIFKFIDIFGLWSLGTLEKKLCTITFSTIYICSHKCAFVSCLSLSFFWSSS